MSQNVSAFAPSSRHSRLVEGYALNLAGLLLFGEQPERFKPQSVVKAVKYPGNGYPHVEVRRH